MANLNLTQSAQSAQIFITLSDNSIATVPDGADPDAYRCYCEAKIKLAANPRKRQRTFVRSSKPSKRINYTERVMAATSPSTSLRTGPFDAGMEAVATRLDELAAIAEEDTFAGGIEWDDPEESAGPANGAPVAIPQSWYTIKAADYTARVDRVAGEISYSG